MNAIAARALRRTYFSRQGTFSQRKVAREALKGIDLEIREGELFGLLGPNGAGKTSFVKVLATVLIPTSGTVEVMGWDVVREVQQVRESIGLVFGGERGLYGSLSAKDTLLFWAAMYKLPGPVARQRTHDALEQVGLAARADERVETFSRGMKQRLHLARGMISKPKVLLLDEPTTGLDPVASREIRRLVLDLNRAGTTVLLTTHYMAEAEALCDRVAFINEGLIIRIDTPAALTRLASQVTVIEADVPVEVAARLGQSLPGATVQASTTSATLAGYERVVISGGNLDYPKTIEVLGRSGALRISTPEPTLEDV